MIPKLDFADAKLFYDLWIPLLDHVNQTYNVNPKLGKMTRADGLNIQEVRVVADFLWSHPAVIDGYLASAELPPDHREIIAGWSRFVSGEFILERNLKRGSVFISSEDEQVYLVSGIFSSWEEMIPQADLPILLRATLIPFKGRIIYDSIVTCSNVIIGRGYAEIFKDIYLSAKQAKSIHTSL